MKQHELDGTSSLHGIQVESAPNILVGKLKESGQL